MTYNPTAEDLLYILTSDGERFSEGERRTMENEITKALQRRGDNGASGAENHVMDAWANRWVELGGNHGQPLTNSLLPPEPGDGEALDPDFAAACVECRSNEPCCFISGTISDRSDSSRKITWPPERIEAGPQSRFATTLLVIAKEQEGMHLVAKVQAKWEGQGCQAGHLGRPRLTTSGLLDGRQQVEEQEVEVATGYYQALNMTLALKKYVPENVLHALFAMDAMLAITSTIKGREGASFTPMQCLTDPSMGMRCLVVPIPYSKLNGKLELASHVGFTTAGVTASAEAKGSLTGQFASYELSAEGSAGGEANTGRALDGESEAPGLIGMMGRIISTLDRYVADGNQQRRELDRTQQASGVRLTKSLTFEPKGFELEAKSNSPDLQLSLTSLTSVFRIGVSGKIDFIDALAMAFTGPGASAIREARARMAAGEHITATLDAYLEMAATGSISHSIDSSLSVTLPANGDLDVVNDAIQQQFGGELRINGKAELAIEVEAKAWIFSACAGASGSLHTSWCWAVRNQDGERQRSYEFEGVVLTLTAYGEIRVRNRDSSVRQTGPIIGNESSTETQVAELFEHVEQHINDSRDKADEIAQQRGESPREGQSFTIWRPQEPQWQAY